MSERAVEIAETSELARVLDLLEKEGEPAVLKRNGRRIARLIPLQEPARTCEELATLWEKMPQMPPDEAKEFAADLEDARDKLPPLKSPWD